MALKLTAEEVMPLMRQIFPQVAEDFAVERLEEHAATMRLIVRDDHLRPGGTVSGPSLFALADVAMYIAVLGMIGRKALAVTTNCSIDFMRKPMGDRDLLADARILKLGRQLAVGDVLIRSDGSDAPVARASLTYSIPPQGSAADIDA
jgi:uncharacterized protein (TIGR00369 family)